MSKVITKPVETTEETREAFTVNVEADKEVTPLSLKFFKTYEEIGVTFSKIMKEVFSDYEGIEFKFLPDGRIQPILYFSMDKNIPDDGRVRAYEPVEINTTNNIGLKAMSVAGYLSRKKANQITQAGEDILRNLVWENKKGDFKFNDNFIEETIPQYANGRQFMKARIQATGFDFIKLLRFIKIAGIDDINDYGKYQIKIERIAAPRYSAYGVIYNEQVIIEIHNMEEYAKIEKKYSIGVMPQIPMGGNVITADTVVC